MVWFNMASQKSKIQLAPPTKYICRIEDGHGNFEIRYHLYFSPPCIGMHWQCNTTPSLIVFQNKIMVTEPLVKSLLAKICCKNVDHEAKLVSIFPTNFLLQKPNLSPGLSVFWECLFRREIGSIIFVMFKSKI